jgi:hypothetical protein
MPPFTTPGRYDGGVARRRELIEIAVPLLGDGSGHDALLRDVADRAGMSVRDLLGYFGGHPATFWRHVKNRPRV